MIISHIRSAKAELVWHTIIQRALTCVCDPEDIGTWKKVLLYVLVIATQFTGQLAIDGSCKLYKHILGQRWRDFYAIA